jgi:DNA-binding MarR family transcriptional regulator
MANVLASLGEGPTTVGRLAERQGVAQPTLTRMVERLESDGLVARQRHPTDGRAVVVSLTPAGEHELAELRARYLAVLAERLEGLTDAQLRALSEAAESLEHLIEALTF